MQRKLTTEQMKIRSAQLTIMMDVTVTDQVKLAVTLRVIYVA